MPAERSEDELDELVREHCAEIDEDIKTADGFASAFIGTARVPAGDVVAVYDEDACIRVFMERDGMSLEDAREFYAFNVVDATWASARPRSFPGPIQTSASGIRCSYGLI